MVIKFVGYRGQICHIHSFNEQKLYVCVWELYHTCEGKSKIRKKKLMNLIDIFLFFLLYLDTFGQFCLLNGHWFSGFFPFFLINYNVVDKNVRNLLARRMKAVNFRFFFLIIFFCLSVETIKNMIITIRKETEKNRMPSSSCIRLIDNEIFFHPLNNKMNELRTVDNISESVRKKAWKWKKIIVAIAVSSRVDHHYH